MKFPVRYEEKEYWNIAMKIEFTQKMKSCFIPEVGNI